MTNYPRLCLAGNFRPASKR
uniref:Uncharacterized protein n=1 Tax=Anguilla anguilla TaxID=7936 RepID=A0A0E9P8R6_ANGAN